VRASGGAVVAVAEEAIAAAQHRLARAGLYVEPTAAATWAGVAHAQARAAAGALVVAPLCGAGLKAAPPVGL
jgi:threonine synthase